MLESQFYFVGDQRFATLGQSQWYSVTDFRDELKSVFGIDISTDDPDVRSQLICIVNVHWRAPEVKPRTVVGVVVHHTHGKSISSLDPVGVLFVHTLMRTQGRLAS